MKQITDSISTKLEERLKNSSLRTLTSNTSLIDFCSNDYLGFARSQKLKTLIQEQITANPSYLTGATGSRLISGNSDFTERLESEIALFHNSEASLIFNSGYDANVGLFSSVPQRGDTILLDELVHASIIDGSRLSNANKYSFKHNDLNSLEEKLIRAKGNIFIGIESVYSMDGDEAPLKEIIRLANQYSAAVIVDEAHAIGLFGKKGRGLVEHYNLSEQVFARIITFGKALGCHGAAVLGSNTLRHYLINYARSFIYTTAASFYSHLSVNMAYNYLKECEFSGIHQKIGLFKKEAIDIAAMFIPSISAIQSILIPGNTRAREVAHQLQKKGFNVRAILHPTIPEGRERLRICLHSFNTDEEITNLVRTLKAIL